MISRSSVRSLRRERGGPDSLGGQVSGRGVRPGPLAGGQVVTLIRGRCGFRRGGCSPPLQARSPPRGPPLRDRALRGGSTGCLLQPVLCMGPHRPPVPSGQRPAAAPRCALCGESHQTPDHRCPAKGCWAKRVHACAHVAVKCRNCSGLHLSQASACLVRGRLGGWPGGGGYLLHYVGSGGR